MKRIQCIVLIVLIALSTGASARNKAEFQTTKLIELQRDGNGFCFVVQVGDLAYLAATSDPPTSNLIVGDPVEMKIDKDHIRVKSNKKWPDVEPDGTIKTTIKLRLRMTPDVKLPSCALPVVVR